MDKELKIVLLPTKFKIAGIRVPKYPTEFLSTYQLHSSMHVFDIC